MISMQAAVVTGPQRFEVQEIERPEVQSGYVLVRVRNCGICGSDLHFYRGDFPAAPGLRLGHEIAGEVAAVGDGAGGLSPGQLVAIEPLIVCRECDLCRTGRYNLCPERKFLGMMAPGGFAEYIHVPAYTVHPLPDGVDTEVGALVEPLAVAVHGLRQAGLAFGERVAIIGSGTIGLMALIAARALGASDVFTTARHAHQAEAARALGAAAAVEADGEAIEKLTAAFDGRPPDVVVETVGGSGETLDQAIAVAARGGRVSILGLFTEPVSFNATAAVMKEVTLYGGITYGRPGARSDFEVALEIATRYIEDLRRVITHRVELADIERGFATAADKAQGSIKVTVEM